MDKTLTITVNGEEVDLVMSYGMMRKLLPIAGELTDVGRFFVDPVVQDQMLIQLLSKRDENGKVTEQFNLDLMDVTVEDVEALVQWAGGHVMDFLLKGLKAANELARLNKEAFESLMPSLDGSKA